MLNINLRLFACQHRLTWAALLGLVTALSPGQAAAQESRTGEQIYRKLCASCHGAAGQGTLANYPRPLVGNRSVPQLSSVIGKTMPEDAPGKLGADEAQKVAAY